MKIDQSFIRNILTNSSCKSVVDMSLECASKLGLKVCLEGVESEEIHDYVANLNAAYHQGFYYSNLGENINQEKNKKAKTSSQRWSSGMQPCTQYLSGTNQFVCGSNKKGKTSKIGSCSR